MSSNQNQPQKPQNSNSIEDLQKKLSILKQAVIDERKKNSEQEKQIKSLKIELQEKEELISKLEYENKSLNNSIIKHQNQKDYYNNLFNMPIKEDITPNEFENTKNENIKLKKELDIYIEQNQLFNEKIANLSIQIDELKNNYDNKIKENMNLINDIKNKENIINNMKNLYDNFEFKKNLNENKAIDLEKLNNKLSEENKKYKKEIYNLNIVLENFSNRLQKDYDEKYLLQEQLNYYKGINKDEYIFKGKIFINYDDINNKNIEIFFKSDDEIEIFNEIENKRKIYKIKDINSIEYYNNKDNYIIINYNDGDEEKEIIGIFNKVECHYIIKFYNEMKSKYDEEKENVEMTTLNLENYSF